MASEDPIANVDEKTSFVSLTTNCSQDSTTANVHFGTNAPLKTIPGVGTGYDIQPGPDRYVLFKVWVTADAGTNITDIQNLDLTLASVPNPPEGYQPVNGPNAKTFPLSPFNPDSAITTLSSSSWMKQSKPVGKKGEGTYYIFTVKGSGVPIIEEGFQWQVSGYLTMDIIVTPDPSKPDDTESFARSYSFDPEVIVGSGTEPEPEDP